MTSLKKAEKQAVKVAVFSKALTTILKNRGRSADSIAAWDILDALEATNLKLSKNDE